MTHKQSPGKVFTRWTSFARDWLPRSNYCTPTRKGRALSTFVGLSVR